MQFIEMGAPSVQDSPLAKLDRSAFRAVWGKLSERKQHILRETCRGLWKQVTELQAQLGQNEKIPFVNLNHVASHCFPVQSIRNLPAIKLSWPDMQQLLPYLLSVTHLAWTISNPLDVTTEVSQLFSRHLRHLQSLRLNGPFLFSQPLQLPHLTLLAVRTSEFYVCNVFKAISHLTTLKTLEVNSDKLTCAWLPSPLTNLTSLSLDKIDLAAESLETVLTRLSELSIKNATIPNSNYFANSSSIRKLSLYGISRSCYPQITLNHLPLISLSICGSLRDNYGCDRIDLTTLHTSLTSIFLSNVQTPKNFCLSYLHNLKTFYAGSWYPDVLFLRDCTSLTKLCINADTVDLSTNISIEKLRVTSCHNLILTSLCNLKQLKLVDTGLMCIENGGLFFGEHPHLESLSIKFDATYSHALGLRSNDIVASLIPRLTSLTSLKLTNKSNNYFNFKHYSKLINLRTLKLNYCFAHLYNKISITALTNLRKLLLLEYYSTEKFHHHTHSNPNSLKRKREELQVIGQQNKRPENNTAMFAELNTIFDELAATQLSHGEYSQQLLSKLQKLVSSSPDSRVAEQFLRDNSDMLVLEFLDKLQTNFAPLPLNQYAQMMDEFRTGLSQPLKVLPDGPCCSLA